MPKTIARYRDKDKARRWRNFQRKENYKRGNFCQSKRRPWTKKEIALIMHSPKLDRILAEQLKRSVSAIQVRRHHVKKENDLMGTINVEMTGNKDDLETALTLIEDFRETLSVKANVIKKDGSKVQIKGGEEKWRGRL